MSTGGIKSWPEDERPREKMLKRGAHSLTDAELLALIIRTGDTASKKSAIDLARELIQDFEENLQRIGNAEISEIMKIKGLGEAKATGIKAAFALASRFKSRKIEKLEKFTNPNQVFEYFRFEFIDCKKELFIALLEVVYIQDHNRKPLSIALCPVDFIRNRLIEKIPVIHSGQRVPDRHLLKSVLCVLQAVYQRDNMFVCLCNRVPENRRLVDLTFCATLVLYRKFSLRLPFAKGACHQPAASLRI